MMAIEDRVAQRFDSLAEQAEVVARTKRDPNSNPNSNVIVISGPYVNVHEAVSWYVSCVDLISQVFGISSSYCKTLEGKRDRLEVGKHSAFDACYGVFLAAKRDYEAGYAKRLADLISAEVFDDFLEMAEHLHKETSHIPAAMLAGAVLEDALRRLCDAHDVDREDCAGISNLNERLRTAEVYDKPLWRRIQGWSDLRNQVDHHNFDSPDEVDAQAVKHMIEGISALIDSHLS